MTSYVLNVVGVVFISIIVDLILPAGKMEKYIKSATALIIVFVIVSPIPNLINKAKNINLETDTTLIDQSFIQKTNRKKAENIEEAIINKLESKGIKNVEIELICDETKDDVVFLFASVNLKKAILNSAGQNINLKEEITKTIFEYISIKKESILFYEWKNDWKQELKIKKLFSKNKKI